MNTNSYSEFGTSKEIKITLGDVTGFQAPNSRIDSDTAGKLRNRCFPKIAQARFRGVSKDAF